MISVNNLYKSYNKKSVLKNINLDVDKGSIASIIGPSGSGKTTLLRCIKQLETIDSGEIIINNKVINKQLNLNTRDGIETKSIGIVFQEFNLFPNLTVEDNLDLPLKIVLKLNKEKRQEKIEKVLREFKIFDKTKSYPNELSGGQKQRVAIARALVMDPEVMLFDEPTSSLDPSLKNQARDLIEKLASINKLTTVIVTHEIEFAKVISKKIFYLDQGEIKIQGSPEEVINSKLLYKI